MDKKALNTYWTFARYMSKVDPKEADTPQAKQLCNDYFTLHKMYVDFMDKVNGTTEEDEKMELDESMEVMLAVVQEFISNHSNAPKLTHKAALAWKTVIAKVLEEENKSTKS